MTILPQIPSLIDNPGLETLKEISMFTYVVVMMALSIASLFIYLYLKEKKEKDELYEEYLKYTKESVKEQINVSKDVIAIIQNTTVKLDSASTRQTGVLALIQKGINDLTTQLAKLEAILTRQK
jgi:hypothetical protein